MFTAQVKNIFLIEPLANAILRFAAEGRILLSFKPPGFFANKYLYIKRDLLDVEMRQMKVEHPEDFESDEDPTTPQQTKGGMFHALIDNDES